MFIVSKIQVHPKKRQTYLVDLESPTNEEIVTHIEVHEDLLIKYGLRKGLALSNEKLRELDDETEHHEVYQSALNYISYRMRSEKEVKTYLEGKGYTTPPIEKVLHKLLDENWLDDQAFANAYVRSKKSLTSKGPAVIRQELFQKGVNEALTDHALLQYSESDEKESARQFAEKKRHSWTNRSLKEQKQKLLQALMQKGFSNEISYTVVNELEQTIDDNSEWEALVQQGEKASYKFRHLTGFDYKMKVKQFLFRKGFQSDAIDKWFNDQNEIN